MHRLFTIETACQPEPVEGGFRERFGATGSSSLICSGSPPASRFPHMTIYFHLNACLGAGELRLSGAAHER